MYKPTTKDKRTVEGLLNRTADRVICHRDGTFTARKGYFYGGLGRTADRFVTAISSQIPTINVIESGNHFASWPQDSYFWVKFSLTEAMPDA